MLSNYEIIKLCYKLKINLNGIYAKDELENINLENGFYIINLDHSYNQGTHWTCFGINNFEHCYFDSFGFQAPQIVEEKLNQNYYWNDTQIQVFNSETCGWWCIIWCYFMQNEQGSLKDKYNLFIHLFNKKNNEDLLYGYLNIIK